MSPAPGACWQQERIVAGFVCDRRALIPLIDAQEDVVRTLLTRGERAVRRFCDVGAGAGAFAEVVMDTHPGATGVLVDFSEPMAAAARERLAARAGRWEYVLADLDSPRWREALPGGSYDAVVSGFCIHHLPDARKRALYRECFELLAPGGLFVNWEHVSAGALVEGILEEQMIERLLAAERSRPDPRPREVLVRDYCDAAEQDILQDAETQCGWLRGIGFADVDVYFKVEELAIIAGVKPGERGAS